jgi:hypothetical protein
MRAHLALTVLALATLAGSVRAAADDPKAVIDRAIKAMGGEAVLARARAYELKMEGAIYSGTEKYPFQAVALTQLPDQFKHVMEYERQGRKVAQVQVYNGNAIFIRVDNSIRDVNPALRSALFKGRYADHLAQLTMLKNKDFQLASLGESKVGGKPVLGVKVTAAEKPEVQLFFDKETGFLVKTEHRQVDPRNGTDNNTEIVQEVFYSDYKVVDTSAADEKLVKDAGVGIDAAGLLGFFRKRGDAKGAKVVALIAQLGDDAFDKREDATNQLIAIGAEAVPLLKDALKNGDLEVVRRAEFILKKIGNVAAKRDDPRVPAAAARLLAAKKPAGAAEALLNFLPTMSDEAAVREIRAALAVVAFTDGKPDKALTDAVEGKDAARRAAAEEALGRTPLPTGRKILLEGLKRPTKISIYRAGKIFMEWQISGVSYFNKLDDKPFVTP